MSRVQGREPRRDRGGRLPRGRPTCGRVRHAPRDHRLRDQRVDGRRTSATGWCPSTRRIGGQRGALRRPARPRAIRDRRRDGGRAAGHARLRAGPRPNRTAFAEEAGTTVLAVGSTVGQPYDGGGWEVWAPFEPQYEAGEYEARDRQRPRDARGERLRRAALQPRVLRGARRTDATTRSPTCASPSRSGRASATSRRRTPTSTRSGTSRRSRSSSASAGASASSGPGGAAGRCRAPRSRRRRAATSGRA